MSAPGEGGPRRDLALLLAIGAFAFALRLACVLFYERDHPHAAAPVIDEHSYDRWARAIAGGDWIGSEVWFQEPLYAYALGGLYALVGPSMLAARIAQALLGALAVLLCGLLARRLFSRAAGLAAAAALAVYGPLLLFPCYLLKENLLLPVLFALAIALARTRGASGAAASRRWLAVGVLGGAGALLRGNVLVLLPALALWPVARAAIQRTRLGTSLGAAALVALGAAALLAPVAWRNWRVGGVFAPTTSGAGTNLYGGNNLENPWGRATEFSFVRGVPEHEARDWEHEAERRAGRELDRQEVSAYWMSEVWRSVRERPFEHLGILWNKLRLTLGVYEVPDNRMPAWDARYVPVARLPWPGFGVLGLLGLTGALLWTGLRTARRAPEVACAGGADELVLLFALYLGTIVLTVTSDRARLPLVVALVPFAGWLALQVAAWARARAWRALVPALLALFVAAVAVHAPALPEEERARDWDERDFNLAVQWLDDPARGADGRAIAERLEQRYPQSARVRLLVGTFELRRGAELLRSADEVERSAGGALLAEVLARASAITDAARVVPRERFRAHELAAWTALELGRGAEAERHFGFARTFDPDAADLRDGQAAARLARARAGFEEGRALLEQQPPPTDRLPHARQLVESALDRSQLVAQDERVAVARRAEARALAGWILLWRGRWPNAERHFRAALELGASAQARLGLAQALVSRAEAGVEGAERAAILAEVAGLVAELRGEAAAELAESGLEARIARLRE